MRKKKAVAITADGRDKGKVFLVTEHDVYDAEDWAINALRLAQRSGVDIPGGIQSGMSGIAAIGILTVLGSATSMDELRPLLATMMREVKIITDQKTQFTRPLVADDIEEISTLLQIRKEWLDLHLNFSAADAISNLISKKTTSASS